MDAGPLADHSTVPYYAQVDVFDPSVDDAIPIWTDSSLGQGIAASRFGMAIATRSDFERGSDDLGTVRIRVWIGEATAVAGSAIYEGTLHVGNEGIVMGSIVGNDLRRVAIPAGDYRVEVFVEPQGAADQIDVVLKQAT